MNFVSKLTPLMLAASLAFSASALAQGQAQQPAPERPIEQLQYTDQELDMFASSYRAIMETREKYAAELADTKDEEEQRILTAKANEEIHNLVGRYGLSVEKYNEITESLQTDPELMQRVMKKLQ